MSRVREDDLVTLADFAEVVWPVEAAARRAEGEAALRDWQSKRQAVLRMQRSKRPSGFPEPVGTAGRAAKYRLGDLARWWNSLDHRDSPSLDLSHPDSAPPEALWLLHRAVAWHVQRSQPEPSSADAMAAAGRDQALAESRRGSAEIVTRAVAAVALVGLAAGAAAGPLVDRPTPSQAVRWLRAASGLPEVVRDAAEVLVARVGVGEGEAASRLVGELAAGVASGADPAALFEAVLAEVSPPATSYGTAQATPEALASAIVAVSGLRPGSSVVDLASGEGNLLLRASAAAGNRLRLSGRELDPVAHALSVIRLHLHRLRATIELGDSVRSPSESRRRADVVLADPPLGERRDFAGWMRRAVEAIAPDGRAVVALPLGTARADQPTWTEVGRDHAEGLVALPKRMRGDAGEPLVLWLLGRHVDRDELRVVDASDLGNQRGTLMSFSPEDLERLTLAVAPDPPPPGMLRPLRIGRLSRAKGPDFDAGRPVIAASAAADPELAAARPHVEELVRLIYSGGSFASVLTAEQRRALLRLKENLDRSR